MHKLGGGGQGHADDKKITRVYAQNYSGMKFIAPSRGQSQVPVCLLVLYDTGKDIYVDHVGVQPHDRDCDLDVDSSTYVRKGFLWFFWHDSTQIREYNEGLLTENAILWEDTWRKMFPIFVAMLMVFIFLFLIPTIQELIHCLLPVGVHVRVSKYDVDYGASLAFP